MATQNPPFRPSPLSFASNRSSPFRRPSTPGSPPGRPGTPGSSPSRGYTPVQSPSKLNQSYTVCDNDDQSNEQISQASFTEDRSVSPAGDDGFPDTSSTLIGLRPHEIAALSNDSAARLTTEQLREIREAFQVLDRDNDGSITREDIMEALQNIGQDSSLARLSQFFPTGEAQSMRFPAFMNILSSLLVPISSRKELMTALAAFDEDDSGQIDVEELRQALLSTTAEAGASALSAAQIDEVLRGFTGRRAFGSQNTKTSRNRGEVFRYHEFVDRIMGVENGKRQTSSNGG